MRACIAALLLLCGPELAAAQLCVGNSAFVLSPIHTAANIDLDKRAHRYTLEARFRYHHAFASAEYGIKTWEITSLDGNSRAVALTLGLQGASARSKFDLCPMLRWTDLSGPHEFGGTYWNYSEHTFSAALSAGYLLVRAKLWDIMPNAALTVGTGDPKLTTVFGGSIQQYQDFCCGRRTFTTLRLGLGLGYSDEFTLVPSISLPLGDGGGAQKTYGIRALLRLGKGI
jgi:hypothetical protein